jgi:hypothetical protein
MQDEKPADISGIKLKINNLAKNSKRMTIRDLCRGINEFKRGYQPRR